MTHTPGFPDGPQVPLMVDGVIDKDTLRQLFQDLATFATILGVREKNQQADYASPEEMTLNTALERLLSGMARATQVRYQFDGKEWSDTILSTQDRFRVVRCRHETT